MSAIAPFAASSFAVLGLTMAAGVTAGTNYLEQDPELALLAGAQVGSVAAGMAFVGAWAERKRMTRIARAAAGLATQLTADGTPGDEAAGSPDGGRALGLLGRVAVLRALL